MYQCMIDDEGREAVFLQTNLKDGSTLSICADCMPVALIGALSTELGADPDRLYEAVQRFLAREVKRQEQQAEAGPPAGGDDGKAASESAQTPV